MVNIDDKVNEFKKFDNVRWPLEFSFQCDKGDYHPVQLKNGEMYVASSYMVGGKINHLITFPYVMSTDKFRLIFPFSEKNIYFYSYDGSLYEYFTGKRLDVLSYNLCGSWSETLILSGETNNTLRTKGVTTVFVHDIDLSVIEQEAFEQKIYEWESSINSIATFKEEFNNFCVRTKKEFASEYILKKPRH